jgi:Reverse transcriptase (RNA-dependent DNA polymerase)
MSDVRELLAATLHRLDLADALVKSEPNDLLPDRVEDSIGNKLPQEWICSLRERIRTCSYRPRQAQSIYVPKTRFTTRPAALVNFEDRIVFEALANALRGPVEPSLTSEQFLYWPRGIRAKKRWQEFKRSPTQNKHHSHIVVGDVAGFYETVDHALLRDSILEVSGWPDLSAAISEFLSILMGRRRGIPQGLTGSDVLATLYLSPVDAELAGRGLQYTRHGDDIRIGARSYEEGISAAYAFEIAVRRQEILANDSKLGIRLRDKYLADLDDVDTTVESLRTAWIGSAAKSAEEDDHSEVTDLITRIIEDHPEFEEVGWEWYRGDLSQDELIELIKPYLKPGDDIVAQQLLRDTFTLLPGGDENRKDQLSQERFTDRFSFALTTLQAAGSSYGIAFCETVLKDYPKQTKAVCRYLASVASSAGEEVTTVCTNLLKSKRAWITLWQ